jgi:(p)ppGpp synthase/HD superfamily hydrolase
VLAKVASVIAEAGSNIDSIHFEEDRSTYTTMHLVIEVDHRKHLAAIFRGLRRLAEVERIVRPRG